MVLSLQALKLELNDVTYDLESPQSPETPTMSVSCITTLTFLIGS